MAIETERAVFTVGLHEGQWAVEHEGSFFDHCRDKELAKAAAHRRARAAHDEGRPSKVQVLGEAGFFSAT